MPSRRFQVNASSKLDFEFVSPKTRPKVLLTASRDITKGVEKKKRTSGQLRGVRAVFAAREKKKHTKMVDESDIAYSAERTVQFLAIRGIPLLLLFIGKPQQAFKASLQGARDIS